LSKRNAIDQLTESTVFVVRSSDTPARNAEVSEKNAENADFSEKNAEPG
jgi:hypothetical protein